MALRREPVAAAGAEPPRFGLIASAPVIPDSEGTRWPLAGVQWEFEQCGEGGRTTIGCLGNTSALDVEPSPGITSSDPFLVFAGDSCSTFGFEARDWDGRARRQLAAIESFEIANELWTGELAQAADGFDESDPGSFYLASPLSDVLTDGPASVVAALACLEAGLAQCGKGRRGMIHVTPHVLTYLVNAQVVTLNGAIYTSPNGHVVVPDAGYDGSGPDGTPAGDSQWIYASGIVRLRLTPVMLTPGSLNDLEARFAALDRDVNTMTVWAQRVALYQVDPCCHLAAEVDLAVCAVGGVS